MVKTSRKWNIILTKRKQALRKFYLRTNVWGLKTGHYGRVKYHKAVICLWGKC
jgi:hypothetical protein